MAVRPFPKGAHDTPYGVKYLTGITHAGYDYAGHAREPIRAIAPGVVSAVRGGHTDARGFQVWVRADAGYTYRMHCVLPDIPVRVGQRVAEGDVLAYVGATGTTATGYHLHLQTERDGKTFDPETLFAAPVPPIDWTHIMAFRDTFQIYQAPDRQYLLVGAGFVRELADASEEWKVITSIIDPPRKAISNREWDVIRQTLLTNGEVELLARTLGR